MALKTLHGGTGEAYIGENPAPRKLVKITMGALAGDVLATAQTTYNLFKITDSIIVTNMMCYTPVAWTTSVTITVGDSVAADGWLKSAKIAPQTAVTSGILLQNSQLSTIDTDACGKLYVGTAASPLYIFATIGGATPAAGQTIFYIEYYEANNL